MGVIVSRASAATVSFATPQEIVINHADDSIRLGDGTRLTTVTAAGALKTDSSAVNQPVSAASLPLPTGASTEATLVSILAAVDGIEILTDDLETIATLTNTLLTTIRDNSDEVEGFVDGLETLLGTTNTLVTGISGFVDQLETYTDGLEGLATSTNAKLDTLHTDLDGVETLITSTNTKLDSIDAGIPAALGQTTMAASMPVVLASNQASIPVAATLTAETTKVIGTVNVAASQTIGLSSGSAQIGHLEANQSTNISQINAVTPLMGAGNTGTGSLRVTIASDQAPYSVNATLAAETTKIIGATNTPPITTASNTRVSVDNSTTVQLLAAAATRKYAYVANNTLYKMWLKLGASAVASQGIPLDPGGVYEITSDNLWTGTVNAISSSSTAASLDIFEGTP